MFEDSVRAVTLQEPVYLWLKKLVWEASQDRAKFQDNRLTTLQTQLKQGQDRLNKLFDLKLDAEINDEMFKFKYNELNENIASIKSQIKQTETLNPNFYEDGLQTLELCKSLYPEYVTRNYDGKAEVLKKVASNYIINDVTICPKYRKPFDLMAKGLSYSLKLPGLDVKRKLQLKHVELLVRMYKRRTRSWEISFGLPFPAPEQKQIKEPKNIAKFAYDVQTYLTLSPKHSQSDAARHFKVSRARISQLLKIANNLHPQLFKKLIETDDSFELKKHSGKFLLKCVNHLTS